MALSGDEDKEMRISGGGLTYDPNENFDHHHHHHHHIPATDQALGAGAAAVVMNSGGSNKSRSPIMGSSPRVPSVRYRECLKNHAASIGGNVTDGCGEFMPTGEEGSLEALKCAACNCHRNFHRKEPVNSGGGVGGGAAGAIIIHPLQHPPPPPPQIPSLNHHHHSHHHHRVVEPVPIHSSSNHHWNAAAAAGMVQPVKMAFGGGGGGGGGGSASGGTDSSSDQEMNFYTYQSTSVQPPPQYVLAKKRFRTKFTPEQKEKMMAFAEKLGWRIPREDDTEVQRFCAENGVKRQVFKVWMHNNKNSGKKNPDDQS